MTYTLPPDTRASGNSGHISDHNNIVDVLTGVGAVYNVLNTAFAGGADPTGVADSTSAMQAAINAASAAGGGIVVFPPGTYKYTTLAGASNVTFTGYGQNVTTLNCTATSGAGITGQSLTNFGLQNLSIHGPNTGTAIGVNLTWNGSSPNSLLNFTNVTVLDFGSHGIQLQNPIVSVFTSVRSLTNGGRGFYFTGIPGGSSGTSCTFNSCFANTNALDGYYLQSMTYCSLNGCAADTNATGYVIAGCEGISLNGCGAEATIAKNSLDGTSFKITQDSGANRSNNVTLSACWCYQNAAVAFWVTGSSLNVQMIGVSENGPIGGATASIKSDAGTMSTIAGVNKTTAYALTSNTYNILNDAGNWTVAGTGNLSTTNFFGIASMNSGSNSSGSAPVLTPTFSNNAAAQLTTTTRDFMVYLQIGTAGTGFTLAIGPTSTPATTLYSSATPAAGDIIPVRLPAGWYLKWAGTSTTIASQTAVGC